MATAHLRLDDVVAGLALMHVPRPDHAVGEWVRVVRPGGVVALSVWDRPERCRLAGVFSDAVAKVGAAPPDELPSGPGFFQFSGDDEREALMRGQGLTDLRSTGVAFEEVFGSADELWEGMLGATVRTSAVIAGQPASVRRRIREAFDSLVEPYATDRGVEIPVAARVSSGRKP